MIKRFLLTILLVVLLIGIATVLIIYFGQSTDTIEKPDKYYSEWMSELKDEVKLSDVVMPGSHDTGTYGMNCLAETQNSKVSMQLAYGVRYFDLRLKEKNDNLYFYHSIVNKNYEFSEFCEEIITFIEENPTEFLILDFQHFGNGASTKVLKMIGEKLSPQQYAVKTNEDLSNLTMGKIRQNNYKYLISWGAKEDIGKVNYIFDRETTLASPYKRSINTKNSADLVTYYDDYLSQDLGVPFHILQAQQTGAPEKFAFNIQSMYYSLKPLFNDYVNSLHYNKEELAKVNVIMQDFVTDDIIAMDNIIKLNFSKENFRIS